MREGARPKRSEATTQGGMRGRATSQIWAGTATQTDPALSSTRDGQLWRLWEPSQDMYVTLEEAHLTNRLPKLETLRERR